MSLKKMNTNPFWGEGENKDFGKVAIEYAAGADVVLDQQFVQYECLVNQAHITMLLKTHILSQTIAKKLLIGLEEIKKLDKEGKFMLRKELEDVHSNVEGYLIEKLGIEVGGYLRLGIARNDQVYTDTRMFMRDQLLILGEEMMELLTGLITYAKKHTRTIMPGYTHLRISQPITYGHWLMGKAYHFYDDLRDILYYYDMVNYCPLGIFEMAGTSLPIDRYYTANLLGFTAPTPHSLYTASQRGEIEAKLLSILTQLALHVRRTMTEVILFSSHEFGLLSIDDAYTTGGTAQPNLKNPDTLEVVRANMARLSGLYLSSILMMDPLPSGFNRDTQQTKPILFESLSLINQAIPIVTGIMTSLTPHKGRMEEVASINFSTAPDVSIQLSVKGNISFRQAYKVVKELIKGGYLKKSFAKLTPELIARVSEKVLGKKISVSQKDIDDVTSVRASAFGHTSLGGSAPTEVEHMIKSLTASLENMEKTCRGNKKKLKDANQLLEEEVTKVMS